MYKELVLMTEGGQSVESSRYSHKLAVSYKPMQLNKISFFLEVSGRMCR